VQQSSCRYPCSSRPLRCRRRRNSSSCKGSSSSSNSSLQSSSRCCCTPDSLGPPFNSTHHWQQLAPCARHLACVLLLRHSAQHGDGALHQQAPPLSRPAHQRQAQHRQFLALAQVGERLQVTPGQWAEWTAEAKATAAARKGDPDQLGFQKRLRDALAAAEAKGGRARRGERSQAAEQAQQAAQRRDADPWSGGGSWCSS